MKGKYILYGAGRQGMDALQKYGKERVAWFCDGYSEKAEIDGIKLIRPEALYKLCAEEKDYTVVITPKIEKVRAEIISELDKRKIPYLIYGKTDNGVYGTKTFRIAGNGASPKFIIDEEETKGYNWRVKPTVAMFKMMFEHYGEVFDNKDLDITVFVGDHVQDAYEQRNKLGRKTIFAYSTVYAMSDSVIPIPDYRFCLEASDYPFEETPEKCKIAAAQPWVDKRIAWRGTIASNDERRWLDLLAAKHPDKLLVEDPAWEAKNVYIPMTELAKYKYTLDIRGYGWTDRVKILMQLGRPLFLVDRPYREWYFDMLIPMKHYVPVKEDLSDLVERYEYLETHPDIYNDITMEMGKFVNTYFAPEMVLEYMKNIVLQFGTL